MERYYNFWRRLGAAIFDGIILLPVQYLVFKYADWQNEQSYFVWTTVIVLSYTVYNVLLTGLVGQTVGKIVMGIKVLDLDEKTVVGLKRAFYRESVPFVLQILSLGYLAYNIFITPSAADSAIEFMDEIIGTASYWWFCAELITMFFNKKRRALHDFLSSSVVISLKGLRYDKHYEALEAKRMAARM